MPFSELLDEDREPFEVLPNACIGPSILVALRVLLATETEFHSWRTLDDAMHLCGTQQEPNSLAMEGSAACSDDSCKDRHEQLRARQEHENGSKRSASGKRDAPHENGDIHGGHGAKKQRNGPARTEHVADALENGSLSDLHGAHHDGSCREDMSDRENISDIQQLQIANTSIQAAPSEALTAEMCTALRHCIQQRLQRYRHAALEQDLQELEAQEKLSQKSAGRSEHNRARLAALRLVVGEKEVLHSALQAIAQRMQ